MGSYKKPPQGSNLSLASASDDLDLGEQSLNMLNSANLSKKNKDLVKLLCTQELKRQKLKLERAKLIEV